MFSSSPPLFLRGKGDTVLSILFDIQAFLMYENREALAAGMGLEAII